MTKDIVGKLRDHLALPVDTEPAVMYLMAEVRKLLDRDDPQHKNLALWMYCHWAVHVDLTNTNTTLHFLEQVDDFITDTVAGLTPNRPYKLIDSHRLFREFVYWEAFRKQLTDVLKSYGLPTDLCDEDPKWFAFLTAYAGVIEDGALSSESKKKDTLKAVDKVTFSKGHTPFSSTAHLPFSIQWDIVLKDGRECRATLEASPDLKMISHHFELTKSTITVPAVAAVAVP
jgi:hypothetical protein